LDTTTWGDLVLYHVTPLDYLPQILEDAALYSASVLSSMHPEIFPRKTSARDKTLGLTEFVHMTVDLDTPMLRSQHGGGRPHVAIAIPAYEVAGSAPVRAVALNASAWRTKAAFTLVDEEAEIMRMVRRHRELAESPGLTILARYGVPIVGATAIICDSKVVQSSVAKLIEGMQINLPAPELGIPPECACAPGAVLESTVQYVEACAQAGAVLPRTGNLPPPPSV
jgi:hypothetical protein